MCSIARNREMLGEFFDAERIPAGGIVYLQREHDETFRLYYNHAPHTVSEVRIALNDQGKVRYETYDTEVACETDEAIYRAERRFRRPGRSVARGGREKDLLRRRCAIC